MITSQDLADLWLFYIVGWGGTGGFTLGLIGAGVAFVLRWRGYRQVRGLPEGPGWGPAMDLAPPPRPIEWFGSWSFIGSVLGASAGVVLWINDLQ